MNQPGAGRNVLVCDGHREGGEDVDWIRAHVESVLPGVRVRIVPELCTRRRALRSVARDLLDGFVVIAVCAKHAKDKMPDDELRETVCRVGSTRHEVVVIASDAVVGSSASQRTRLRAAALAAAVATGPAIAEILAVGDAADGNAGVSRRDLFRIRLLPRHGVPELPLRSWETYLGNLLSVAPALQAPIGISWACHVERPRADACAPSDEPDEAALRLRVPCVGALTPAWVLQPLAAGATSVAVTPCEKDGAMWQFDGERSGFLETILGAPSLDPRSSTSTWRGGRAAGGAVTLREPVATADALVRLEFSGPVLRSIGSPLGVLDVGSTACTACGLCAEVCPTSALTARSDGATWTLAFDHRNCTGCGACTGACPEHVLNVTQGIDPSALRGGRRVTVVPQRNCEACKAPLPPAALLARLGAAGVQVPGDGICGDCRIMGRRPRVGAL
jgi:ferredoxin